MKILLANGSAYPAIGGVENSLNYMAQALIQKGHQVKILCFRRSAYEPSRIVHNNVEIIYADHQDSRLPNKSIFNAVKATTVAINALLNEYTPDEIWTRRAAMGLGVARSQYRGALKHVFPTTAKMDSKGLYLNTQGLPLLRRIMLMALWPLGYTSSLRVERELLKYCQPVVFSELMANQLTLAHAQERERIWVVRPGVDMAIFSAKFGAKHLEDIEGRYGVSRGEKYVLYVGRLAAAKNITLLVDAIKVLPADVKLLVVGKGAEEVRLTQYVEENSLTDRVIFLGSQSEYLPTFYLLATVCVLPTTVESFGQTFLESMSCGTPVVGFESDGCDVLTASQEIIQHGITGQLVREITATGLARGIAHILELDGDAYARYVANCRADVKARFCWSRFVDEMLSITGKVTTPENV